MEMVGLSSHGNQPTYHHMCTIIHVHTLTPSHTHPHQIEVNPLEIALETLGAKNREIQTLTSQYSANKTLNINPLSMLLNGVIDAAVMGGLSNYEKVCSNNCHVTSHDCRVVYRPSGRPIETIMPSHDCHVIVT